MEPNFTPSSAPFDTALAGTRNDLWERMLIDAPRLPLPAADLLVVSPHPDDETFGAGGLMSTAAACGRQVTVLSITDGEGAHPDWQDLRGVRRHEVDEALEALAPVATLRRLSVPDGGVAAHRGRVSDAIEEMIGSGTTLVAPFECDGHMDHDAVGAICVDIARRHALPLWRYPIWAWHQSTPTQMAERRWGCFRLDAQAQRRKARAIECFESQLRPPQRMPVVPSHVLAYFARPYEAFIL